MINIISDYRINLIFEMTTVTNYANQFEENS